MQSYQVRKVSYKGIFGPSPPIVLRIVQKKLSSFVFGTDDARSPSVLASPLRPMGHAVQVSYLRFWDQWHLWYMSFGPY